MRYLGLKAPLLGCHLQLHHPPPRKTPTCVLTHAYTHKSTHTYIHTYIQTHNTDYSNTDHQHGNCQFFCYWLRLGLLWCCSDISRVFLGTPFSARVLGPAVTPSNGSRAKPCWGPRGQIPRKLLGFGNLKKCNFG